MMETLPNGRHQAENYWSQMKSYKPNINSEQKFWDAFHRTYKYYKDLEVGHYFRNKNSQQKNINYFQKKQP